MYFKILIFIYCQVFFDSSLHRGMNPVRVSGCILSQGNFHNPILCLQDIDPDLGRGILDPALPDETVDILINEYLFVSLVQNILLGCDTEVLDHVPVIVFRLHVFGHESLHFPDCSGSPLGSRSPLGLS